jgi:hypothetical protein
MKSKGLGRVLLDPIHCTLRRTRVRRNYERVRQVLVTSDRGLIVDSVSETVEAFSSAFYGLCCTALARLWPMIILALNAIPWVINELVHSN